MAIVIFPLFITKIHRSLVPFIVFFGLLLAASLISQFFTDVHFWQYSGLKRKYVISVVRFAELMLCVSTALVLMNVSRKNEIDFTTLVSKFISHNYLLTFLILMLFAVDFATGKGIVSYANHRLRGFYVEGGPFGLYMASLIFLEYIAKRRKLPILIFSIALGFSQSKAGICALAAYMLIAFMMSNRFFRGFLMPKNILRFSFFVMLSASVSAFAIAKVAYNYVDDYQNVYSLLKGRSDDPSLVMGRIAASHIGPRIFEDNPVFGVGLGAYSLVRNNTDYRYGFPVVEGWDLTGLGGFFNLMIENGVFGVAGFILVILFFFKKDLPGMCFMMLFVIPFIFGAQLYMVYPWVFLGLYCVYMYGYDGQKNKKKEYVVYSRDENNITAGKTA